MANDLRASVYGRDVKVDGWPTVSVIMPIRNEAEHVEAAVASILTQRYPIDFDVSLAVGPSDDDTELIVAAIAAREPRVSVVPNPAGVTPAGLNAAISATTGEVIVRVDGHARLSDGYIQRAVETMIRTGAVNVGGIQDAQGQTRFEQALAASMRSWIGTGGAKFHVGGTAGPVDTVYLGVFDRAAGTAVGWFDEHLIRNQDYELNIRLRKAGGVIWFDPQLSVTYRPRSTWRSLTRQYYEYGYWKAEVLRMHPSSLKLRQLVPAACLPLAGIGIGSIVVASTRRATVRVALPFLGCSVVLSAQAMPAPFVNVVKPLAWSTGFWRWVLSSFSLHRS